MSRHLSQPFKRFSKCTSSLLHQSLIRAYMQMGHVNQHSGQRNVTSVLTVDITKVVCHIGVEVGREGGKIERQSSIRVEGNLGCVNPDDDDDDYDQTACNAFHSFLVEVQTKLAT